MIIRGSLRVSFPAGRAARLRFAGPELLPPLRPAVLLHGESFKSGDPGRAQVRAALPGPRRMTRRDFRTSSSRRRPRRDAAPPRRGRQSVPRRFRDGFTRRRTRTTGTSSTTSTRSYARRVRLLTPSTRLGSIREGFISDLEAVRTARSPRREQSRERALFTGRDT